MKMSESNWMISMIAIVIIVGISCATYADVVRSNNSKEVVTRAIERGLDPISAACASNMSSSMDVRSTCEKLTLIKSK